MELSFVADTNYLNGDCKRTHALVIRNNEMASLKWLNIILTYNIT